MENLTFEYRDDGSSDDFQVIETVSGPGSSETYNWDLATPGSGDYELRARTQNSDGSQEDTASRSIIIDNSVPSPDSVEPEGPTSEDNPEVSMSVTDDLSGVNYSYLNVTDSDDNDVDSVKGTELDLSDLNDEQYTVDYSITDNAGNWRNSSWTFTVDTSYEGDTEPDLDWDATVNDDYVLMDDDVELTLTYDDQDENPATARCFDGDTDDSDNEIDEDEVNDLEAVCDFDEHDFADGQDIDLTIQSCDEAGNCETYDAGSYTFDKNDPELESVSPESDAVNSDFEVDFEATDSSGLQEAEYFFEATVESGEGNAADIDSISDDVSSSLTVDTSDMESGEDRTVYFRVQDSAGRWSNIEQIEVDYFPEASADLALTAPDSVEASATNESTIEYTVDNNGRVPAEDIEVSFSGLTSDSATISEILPESSITSTWSFTPEKSDIGEKQINISLEGYGVSKTVDVRVKASSSQQESISSKLSTYQEKLDGLKSNTSSLNSKLGKKLSERLQSNVSGFESSIEEADQAISSGEYYRAQEILSDIDTEYSGARNSYQEVRDQYQSNQRRNMMLAGVGAVLLILLGGGAFAYREGMLDEYDLDSDLGAVAGKIENLDIDFGSSEDEEESDDEFAWDGFN